MASWGSLRFPLACVWMRLERVRVRCLPASAETLCTWVGRQAPGEGPVSGQCMKPGRWDPRGQVRMSLDVQGPPGSGVRAGGGSPPMLLAEEGTPPPGRGCPVPGLCAGKHCCLVVWPLCHFGLPVGVADPPSRGPCLHCQGRGSAQQQ